MLFDGVRREDGNYSPRTQHDTPAVAKQRERSTKKFHDDSRHNGRDVFTEADKSFTLDFVSSPIDEEDFFLHCHENH